MQIQPNFGSHFSYRRAEAHPRNYKEPLSSLRVIGYALRSHSQFSDTKQTPLRDGTDYTEELWGLINGSEVFISYSPRVGLDVVCLDNNNDLITAILESNTVQKVLKTLGLLPSKKTNVPTQNDFKKIRKEVQTHTLAI